MFVSYVGSLKEVPDLDAQHRKQTRMGLTEDEHDGDPCACDLGVKIHGAQRGVQPCHTDRADDQNEYLIRLVNQNPIVPQFATATQVIVIIVVIIV